MRKTLYSKDSMGRIRIWEIKTEGNEYAVRDGLIDGNIKEWTWTECFGKNEGKSNETDCYEQAELEANALCEKKLKEKYFSTEEEARNSIIFKPMLAHKYDKSFVFKEKKWASQPKLDGVRGTTIWSENKTKLISRSMREIVSCGHICEEIPEIDFYLDGELYNHSMKDDFNGLISLIRKEKLKPEDTRQISKKVEYHVYDGYWPKEPNLKYSERLDRLIKFFRKQEFKSIKLVDTDILESADEIDALFSLYLSNGYEGQILRNVNSKYKVAGRSKDLLKNKTFMDEEFPIIRIEQGKGQWSGIAKRVFVNVNGNEVGCGVKGDQYFLTNVLRNKKDYVGKLATVQFFGYTPDGSLRFPVVKDLDRYDN